MFLWLKKYWCKNAIKSLQEVWLSKTQITKKNREIKSWFRNPIYSNINIGLIYKNQAQIRDQRIEPYLVKKKSISILRFWLSF